MKASQIASKLTGIGLAPLASAAPIYVSYDMLARGSLPEKTLELGQLDPVDPLQDLSQLTDKAALTLKFGKHQVDNVVIIQAYVRNNGKAPILPADFHEPLSVSISSPFRILAVENSTTFYPADVKLKWTSEAPDRFVAASTLFNPGDAAAIIIYATNTNFDAAKGGEADKAKVEFNVRVVNMKSLTKAPDLFKTLEAGYWGLIVILSGWSLIYTVVAALGFQAAYMYLLSRGGYVERFGLRLYCYPDYYDAGKPVRCRVKCITSIP